ncbi:TetR/AcrR family transcriptional regulator [Dactylosporangium sp. CS-033363]|uniref:TetR/AcrR family transcriptional regulator n=1 Tax=Dactylosporangium sp. CS-033363 TaxID=3239935 RepID=UPI003D914F7A
MQATLTLRERQRREILQLLHEAAIALVHESGLAGATVDAITQRAGVSRRTFFNYYASKEDAILGTTAPVVPESALAEFFDDESGIDQFTRTIRLISAIVRTTREVGRIEAAELRDLFGRFPELRMRLQQHTAAAERLVEGVLVDHFSRRDADSTQAADSARALLLLASAVMRFAYSRDPDVLDAPDREAVRAAIDVFKTALAGVS